ncbi:MAG TPA: glycosyltransferase [Acidimicrobiales bacterium]|nr:glycosyltransferase [Acidimicrobiales bacterium]
MTPVRAVVVHRNQPERCRRTVAALHDQGVPVDVVIVDNASTPEAVATVRAIGGARVVESGGNLGFGGGANTGIRMWLCEPNDATRDWVLVLPHDAEPAPDCLRRMLEAVSAPSLSDVGMVSAEYGDDEVPVVDAYFGALTAPAERGEGFVEADYAHGTFLLLRRAMVREVGLFDEAYFAYCEEADLSLRARRAGWRSGMVWGAVVKNPHQGSPPPLVDYLMVRNTVVLVRRHFGRYRAVIRFLIVAASTPWHALRSGGSRSPWFDARARLYALRDLVLLRLGPPPPELLER